MFVQRSVSERQLAATVSPVEDYQPSAEAAENWRQQLVIVALVLSDVGVAFFVWEAAYVLQGLWGRGPLTEIAVATVAPTVAVWIGLRALLGLYPGYGLDQAEQVRRHTYSVFVTMAVTAVFAVALRYGDLLSRLLLLLGFLSLLLLAPFVQQLVKQGLRRGRMWGRPVVIVGSKDSRTQVTRLLRQRWELGYNPVAVFDYALPPVEGSSGSVDDESTSLAGVALLARRRGANTIIFALPRTRREQVAKLVGWASLSFRHVMIIPNLDGVTNSAVTARNLAGTFGVEIKYNLLDPWALRVKRMLDLAATAVGGVVVVPLIALLALMVWLESGGPVFYKAPRIGKDFKLFSCVKFRTMVNGAEDVLQRLLEENPDMREEYLRYHKLRADPRITRVGRFLRRTSLDELPQLWNVLRGEMSLVGPRPYLPRESADVGVAQSEILRVPPGITGPWQVDGRNHANFSERVQMDTYYVRDWSVWLDLVLLIRTIKCVALSRGAY